MLALTSTLVAEASLGEPADELARRRYSHTLGVGQAARLVPGIPEEARGLSLSKAERGLDRTLVEQIMGSAARPAWMAATITSEPGGYAVHVATLIWGVTRMLRNLFADAQQANAEDGALVARPVVHQSSRARAGREFN